MADAGAFGSSLDGIVGRLSDDMNERDVENAFLDEDFYSSLGYEGAGRDVRSEWTLPDNRRPDYVTLDANESVTCVYEFKTTGRDLEPHREQLFHYVEELKADYGVLTNGERIVLYKRSDTDTPDLDVRLAEVTDIEVRNLYTALHKPEWDITDPASVHEYVRELDPIALNGDLGQDHFFDTFRLEENSPFADLVVAMTDLLGELRDEREAPFVEGAYDFWEASYASEPDDVPDAWAPFIETGSGSRRSTASKKSLRDFMFCLESGHALLSRLLLAKACEDRDFFPQNTGFGEYFRELQGFGDSIDLDAYPVAASGLLEEMRDHLVESLFEDDIFVWWTDGYSEETASLHADPYARFLSVAKEGSRGERVSRATRERFSRAVANCFFSVVKFDMAAVEGDPLGDLYQRYFDPETRKALGEFYTPTEVVEYIMDGVEYDRGVSAERLMDPACGSGTFLVEAVSRYLADVRRYDEDPDWEEHLRALCTRPHVVGLDVHPFAVLMAQIRFMIEILPEYREAKRKNPNFTLRRLPIFRTDTLRNERKSTGIDIGESGDRQLTWDAVTESNQDVYIPIPLPIEIDDAGGDGADSDGGDGGPSGRGVETEDGFLVQRVRMPKFDTIQLETGVSNFGEYFAALQGVLDVVKWHMSENAWEYGGGLVQGIGRYTTREYDGIEAFFEPYVDELLETVRYLREDHGDGRLFKMFEDSVLALVVKNYMDYEYVVGNPPYVRIQHLSAEQKAYLGELYDSATGNYDLYCPFYERGLDWLTEGDGRLGYITPNQFMVTDYGEGIRRVMLEEAAIEEVYDFRDSGVFEDATNYPAIVILRDEENEEPRQEDETRCVRVKANVDDESGRELDQQIVAAVRNHRDDPGYGDEFIDVFDFPQNELDEGYWAIMPPEELEVFNKLRRNGDAYLSEITDSVFAGTQTSANKIYVVAPLDADRIEPNDTGETVTIVPSGENQEYEIETDLLCPWLKGRDIQRWQGEWSGQHVILPYYVEYENDEANVCVHSQDYLRENLPLTWNYFSEHREQLENREGGKMRGRDDWYAFIYPKSHERFEQPKLIGAHISENARFMADGEGRWYFKTAYGIQLNSDLRSLTNSIAGELNSLALDFYFKHITTVKAGGYYEYRAQYLEELPCMTSGGDDEFERIDDFIGSIIGTIDTENKTGRFPEAYLGEFSGELQHVDYEWQTARRPVDASIQSLAEGGFAVEAGRTDSIRDPRMGSETRARYVHAAVDGRNVTKGEAVSIPIPRRDADVAALLEDLEADRETVAATDIEALEAEIDEIVYDLFELTEEEREVIEDFLEVF